MEDFRIIMDANFLMIPESHGVNIFNELDRIVDRKYELFVPEVVIGELENLKENGTPFERKAAKVGVELASKAKKIPSEKPADEEILRLTEKGNCAVATSDSNLQKRLREEGIPVIYLRQRTHLEIEGSIK
ncbi:hypothetical protein AKJ41_02305 [candidate division MSBL1 archaeon SCGC-AAA259O05]|uniref:PIN domain-containing protein n=1 Tax=candidate division MSBL1 archaeon SCGC-AAA259O05 TaxID=1698271 RepID=A0A133V466_9EURY|nr:hypothetical protein AKJ41_02305 [candidate division MSBL1 archaeon SCGC-AAA259O05]